MLCSDGNRIVPAAKQPKDLEGQSSGSDIADPKLNVDGVAVPVEEKKLSYFQKAKKAALHGLVYDIHAVIEDDDHLKDMHDHGELSLTARLLPIKCPVIGK